MLTRGAHVVDVVVLDVSDPDMSDVEVVEADRPPFLVIADFNVRCTVEVSERLDIPDGSLTVERTTVAAATVYALISVEFDDAWAPQSLSIDEPAIVDLDHLK